MVNTEPLLSTTFVGLYYNILNIVVNTEHIFKTQHFLIDYNILNIVVNTERKGLESL